MLCLISSCTYMSALAAIYQKKLITTIVCACGYLLVHRTRLYLL